MVVEHFAKVKGGWERQTRVERQTAGKDSRVMDEKMLPAKRWWAKITCRHEWEFIEEHTEPGPVQSARWGVRLTPTHRAQQFRCRKCGAVKFEQIP
jgi:hypothetical protein